MRLNWKKTGLITLDVILGAYIILAFTAFNKPDETSNLCVKVDINIQDVNTNGFIDAKEIKGTYIPALKTDGQHQYQRNRGNT